MSMNSNRLMLFELIGKIITDSNHFSLNEEKISIEIDDNRHIYHVSCLNGKILFGVYIDLQKNIDKVNLGLFPYYRILNVKTLHFYITEFTIEILPQKENLDEILIGYLRILK